jgi:hypothetical protein
MNLPLQKKKLVQHSIENPQQLEEDQTIKSLKIQNLVPNVLKPSQTYQKSIFDVYDLRHPSESEGYKFP